jgi:hypothetical protein
MPSLSFPSRPCGSSEGPPAAMKKAFADAQSSKSPQSRSGPAGSKASVAVGSAVGATVDATTGGATDGTGETAGGVVGEGVRAGNAVGVGVVVGSSVRGVCAGAQVRPTVPVCESALRLASATQWDSQWAPPLGSLPGS